MRQRTAHDDAGRVGGGGDCADAMGRVPFASLIALMLCWIGVGLFCTMMYQAVHASVDQAKVALGNPAIQWLDKIQVTFIIVAVVMALLALVLVVVSALATGATRAQVYTGVRARLGGRLGCALFMALTYAMTLVWLAVLSLSAALALLYVVFGRLCREVDDGRAGVATTDAVCLDFTVFAPVLLEANQDRSVLNLCDGRLRKWCALTGTAATWYYVGYGGAALVLLGLLHYMIAMAANYVRIERGTKYQELENIWSESANEMASYDAYQGARPNHMIGSAAGHTPHSAYGAQHTRKY